MEFPVFKYHPDPRSTGAVVAQDSECPCCKRVTGFAYTGSVYAEEELEDICPWCIASGEAAKMFDATFSDDAPLIRENVPSEVVEEVTRRTPGYTSWQQEEWLACCGDACAFHGDLTAEELATLDAEAVEWFDSAWDMGPDFLASIAGNYQPGGDPALYKFVCRHCRRVRVGWDCS